MDGLGAALKLACLALLLGAATPLAAGVLTMSVGGATVTFSNVANAQLQVTVVSATPFSSLVINNGLAGFGPSGLETATLNGAYTPGWVFIPYSPGVFGVSNPYAPLLFEEHVQVSNTYVFIFSGNPFWTTNWGVTFGVESLGLSLQAQDAPEPGTYVMVLAGISAFVIRRRRLSR